MDNRTLILMGGVGALAYVAYQSKQGTGGRPWGANGLPNPNWKPGSVDEDIINLPKVDNWVKLAIAQKMKIAANNGVDMPLSPALAVIPQMYAWDTDEVAAVWLRYLNDWEKELDITRLVTWMQMMRHFEINLTAAINKIADRVGYERVSSILEHDDGSIGVATPWRFTRTFTDMVDDTMEITREESEAFWYAIESMAVELAVEKAWDPAFIESFMDAVSRVSPDAPRLIGDIAAAVAQKVGEAGGAIGGGFLSGFLGRAMQSPAAVIGGLAIIYYMATK